MIEPLESSSSTSTSNEEGDKAPQQDPPLRGEVQIFIDPQCRENHQNFKNIAVLAERAIEISEVVNAQFLAILQFHGFDKLNKSCNCKVFGTLVQ